MMASLYSGVSGLKNHQTRMDVIGNNISNVNTAGFKASRVVFKDVMSQTISGAGAANNNVGGVNANQIGLGVTLGTIDTLFGSVSTLQRTDDMLDLAISGDGFFCVVGADGQPMFTRVGNFYTDAAGDIVTAEGYYVQGYAASKIYQMDEYSLSKLEKSATINSVDMTNGYDGRYTITSSYDPTGGSTGGEAIIITLTDEYGESYDTVIDVPTGGFEVAGSSAGNYTFDIYLPDGSSYLTIDIDVTEDISGEDMAALLSGTVGKIDYEIDYDNLVNMSLADYEYKSYTIEPDGSLKIIDQFNNEVTVGQFALAMFTNNAGLEKAGNSYYYASANSGNPLYTSANEDGAGSIATGYLEMSNVDLSTEFTDMIVTQRGFQANSRIITTSDSMLEELVNLKR